MTALRYWLDFEWARGLPAPAVKACFLAVFALVFAFALAQDESFVYKGAPDRARWRDLRLWSAVLMLFQACLYSVL